MSDRLLVIHNGAQVTVQLNRPDKLNAINVEMLDALDTAVQDITANREVRVVLLTGAGDKAFSVGADIHAWSALEPLAMWHEWIVRGHRVFDRLAALHQPGTVPSLTSGAASNFRPHLNPSMEIFQS